MAVPYEACDLPSQRSEYKHPDASIALTILAYYQSGLTELQLREVLHALAKLEQTARDKRYRCATSHPMFHVVRLADCEPADVTLGQAALNFLMPSRTSGARPPFAAGSNRNHANMLVPSSAGQDLAQKVSELTAIVMC